MNRIKNIVFITGLFFLLPLTVSSNSGATTDAKPLVYKAFQYIYNFEFQKADSVRTIVNKTFPGVPYTHLLNANYFWWRIISGEDAPENITNYNNVVSSAVAAVKGNKKATFSNEEVFVFINLYAFRVRLDLLHYKIISAITKLDECIKYFKLSFGNEAKFAPFSLTSGLYNYFVAYATDTYPITVPYFMFYPKGDIVKGLAQLSAASISPDIILNTEGNYFLMKIYFEQRKNFIIAKAYSKNLVAKYPKNLLYQYFYFSILNKGGEKSSAHAQLKVLMNQAYANKQISQKQRNYFINMAEKEIK
jgi:hypothetical protein